MAVLVFRVLGAVDAKVFAVAEAPVADSAIIVDAAHKNAFAVGIVEPGLLRVARPARCRGAGVSAPLAGVSGLVLAENLLDHFDGRGERGRLLQLHLEVDLHLDRVAEVSSCVEQRLGRDQVRAATVAHLRRVLVVVLSVAIECDHCRCLDALGDELESARGCPRGKVVVSLVVLRGEEGKERDAAGRGRLLVVLSRLVATDRVGDVIE